MEKILKYSLRILLVIVGLSLISISLALLITDYESFVHTVLEEAGKLHKIDEFKENFLTLQKYQFIRYLFLIISICFIGGAYFAYKSFESKLISLCNFIKASLQNEIRKISKKDFLLFWIIFISISLVKIYYYFNQVITNDEAFTYISYVNQGFAAALTFYNLTNNHILHSLLCNVFDFLPISPVYSLRIASFLAGSATLFAAFILFRKMLRKEAAFFALVFFAFAPPVVQYGFLARGYSFILLFAIISTYALWHLINNNNKKVWSIFIISSVLGFYSIPIYVYVFVSHLTFYFIYSLTFNTETLFNKTKSLFLASAIVSILVMILYTPVILVSGLDSLIGNEYVKGNTMHEFISALPISSLRYIQWIFGGNIIVSVVGSTMIIAGLYYSLTKRKNLFILIISFFIVPFVMVTIQQITLYDRLFLFNHIFIAIALGLFVEFIINKNIVKKKMENLTLYVVSILLASTMLFSINIISTEQNRIYKLAYNFSDKIETSSSIFLTHQARYYTFLKFKGVLLDEKQIELFREDFDANFEYDYIAEVKLKNENYSKVSKYQYSIIFEDEFISLYKKDD